MVVLKAWKDAGPKLGKWETLIAVSEIITTRYKIACVKVLIYLANEAIYSVFETAVAADKFGQPPPVLILGAWPWMARQTTKLQRYLRRLGSATRRM